MSSADIWNDFRDNHTLVYQQLKKQLIDEQGSICAYCNQKILNDGNTQIEHIEDKSLFISKIFDYNNLVACCLGGEKEPKPRDLYCGSQKNRYYQQNGYTPLVISPIMASCETDISCQLDGKLVASSAHIQQCIDEILGLNAPQFTNHLTGLRKRAISAILFSNYEKFKLHLLQLKFKPNAPMPKLVLITQAEAAIQITKFNRTTKPYSPFCKAIVDVLKKQFNLP